jgi:N-acetyl-anhydromuramyl-L-alanine amidase AmpD
LYYIISSKRKDSILYLFPHTSAGYFLIMIKPKGIIVHSMAEFLRHEGKKVTAHEFLKILKLSVHGFIHPNGEYERMIKTPGRAAHAGKSIHENLSGLNSHFLGFELLVPGEHDYGSFLKAIDTPGTYTEEQFEQAVQVCKYWMKQYDIPVKNVVRHSDVSGDHVRGKGKGKKDPGSSFEWEKFVEALS